MTDSIDLDELEVDESQDDERESNYGDWFWRGGGDPDGESRSRYDVDASIGRENVEEEVDDGEKGGEGSSDSKRTPRIPRTPGKPVGVPAKQGGAGAGPASRTDESSPANSGSKPDRGTSDTSPQTTGHGGAEPADDMTLALTFQAINRLANPRVAIADARGWADWIGIVGEVSTPVIRKFQRDAMIDLDFFGGSETGPDARLADVTPESMFYADRMVLVGCEGEERIADAADWEFVPLETAAEKAGWEVEHPE
ncbi:hypothetical protein ACFQGT_16835 [Natrialbaceae archaeon GCM10025810]|uniref:DUF7124 domain-containing protein n=1 Tax=Halovalidus salilacus TaxID=3075124 RepID=UPI0036109CEF